MPLCTIGHRFAQIGELEQLFVVDWREALLFQHDWDAHAWPYVVFNGDEPAPAARVASVAGKPALSEGQAAICWLVFLDFDRTADHSGILNLFTSRIPDSHYLAKYTAVYPTRSGMRFVYELESPILAEEYGAVVRGFAFDLAMLTGLQVDVSTDQWSRCMRLPSVTRDDEKAKGPTWQEPYWFETLVQDAVVPNADLRPRQDRLPWDTRGRQVAALAGEDVPDVDQVLPDNRVRAYKKAMRSSRFRDYVFADDYKLMPLEELRAYVAENKHLPGVLYAEEVVNQGLDLGKMDAKLLEKVEELTLYILELEAKVNALESNK